MLKRSVAQVSNCYGSVWTTGSVPPGRGAGLQLFRAGKHRNSRQELVGSRRAGLVSFCSHRKYAHFSETGCKLIVLTNYAHVRYSSNILK